MSLLLTTKQVAERKGVTVKTVNLWAQTGRLPVAEVLPISNARMYDPQIVDAFDPKAAPAVSDSAAGSRGDAPSGDVSDPVTAGGHSSAA